MSANSQLLMTYGGAANIALYHRNLTIDHTKVGTTDRANFPTMVQATDTTLKTVSNGGHVNNSNGYDITFWADSGFTTPLNWELANYNATTGAMTAFVKTPTVSHTTDTPIYMSYGNASISTFQGGATGAAWDSDFMGVYHLGNGTTLSLADSTSNTRTLTNHGATAASGGLFGCAAFNGASWIDTLFHNLWTFVGSQVNSTVEVGCLTTASSGRQVIIADWNSSGLDLCEATEFGDSVGNYKIASGLTPTNIQIRSATTPAANTTYYLATTTATSSRILYQNGASAASDTTSMISPVASAGELVFGRAGNLASLFLNGKIWEVRISKITRSADWILTTYNNLNAPGNIGSAGFITFGSEY